MFQKTGNGSFRSPAYFSCHYHSLRRSYSFKIGQRSLPVFCGQRPLPLIQYTVFSRKKKSVLDRSTYIGLGVNLPENRRISQNCLLRHTITSELHLVLDKGGRYSSFLADCCLSLLKIMCKCNYLHTFENLFYKEIFYLVFKSDS